MSESAPLLDVRIAELAGAVLDETMVERDDPWVYRLDDVDGHDVVIAVNTDEPNEIEPDDCMKFDAEPFRMLLWDNGWLAYIGPQGDRHVGDRDDEDRWIDALEDEIRACGGDVSPEEGSDAE